MQADSPGTAAALPRISVAETLADRDRDDWMAFLARAARQHPRQDPRFAAAERADGHDVRFTIARDAAGAVTAVGLWSLRRHPFLPGAHADAQCLSGPVADDPDALLGLLAALAVDPAFARIGRLRITPFWTGADAATLTGRLAAAGWRRAEADAFRQTGWVDLAPGPEGILARFSKSARREYRRAERQGVGIARATTAEEAGTFLASLNRLRASRGLAPVAAPGFLAAFEAIHAGGDAGVLLIARHEGRFLAGLQLYRGAHVAHGRHFTTETDLLRGLSNLRIAPLLWHHGMIWARARGCRALDVEGWRADAAEGDPRFGIYKYKSEFAPEPVLRIAEHALSRNALVGATGNLRGDLRMAVRRLRRALR